MVKRCRFPSGFVVARSALGRDSTFRELTAMNILVAAATCGCRPAKYDLTGGLRSGRTMAFRAGNGAVCAAQRKRSGGMIEGAHFSPGTDGMANITILFRWWC